MNKLKLLVIDDEPAVVDMIHAHFSERGFDVSGAPDGWEGIKSCNRILPDVILLDLKMKEVDGEAALPQLRYIVPNAKIFIISALEETLLKSRMLALGADAYFQKPASLAALEKAIRGGLK